MMRVAESPIRRLGQGEENHGGAVLLEADAMRLLKGDEERAAIFPHSVSDEWTQRLRRAAGLIRYWATTARFGSRPAELQRNSPRLQSRHGAGRFFTSGANTRSNDNENAPLKKTKLSIALYIVHPDGTDRFLIVKRPFHDDALPDLWGLPATTCADRELPEAAAVRVGREKLNTEVQPIRTIGVKFAEHGDYNLVLIDIEARLVGGPPSVFHAKTPRTKYVDQQWTNDFSALKEAASKGSLCSQIILDANRIKYM